MAKHVASTLAIAAGLLAASSGALKAQEKMTIGISYQNLAFPYVAALQKAAENACKGLAFEAASLDASVASINAANKKGVPVVQFNGKASGGDYVTFVGSAQTDSGVKLGQFLADLYKKLGKEKLRGIY